MSALRSRHYRKIARQGIEPWTQWVIKDNGPKNTSRACHIQAPEVAGDSLFCERQRSVKQCSPVRWRGVGGVKRRPLTIYRPFKKLFVVFRSLIPYTICDVAVVENQCQAVTSTDLRRGPLAWPVLRGDKITSEIYSLGLYALAPTNEMMLLEDQSCKRPASSHASPILCESDTSYLLIVTCGGGGLQV